MALLNVQTLSSYSITLLNAAQAAQAGQAQEARSDVISALHNGQKS